MNNTNYGISCSKTSCVLSCYARDACQLLICYSSEESTNFAQKLIKNLFNNAINGLFHKLVAPPKGDRHGIPKICTHHLLLE